MSAATGFFGRVGNRPLEPSHIDEARDRVNWGWILALGLLCMVRLSFLGGDVLADPDTMWHVATGKLIWNSLSVPHVDTWSHTFTGQPWIARDWLAQLLLYAGFAIGGWPGTAIASWIAISVSIMILLRVLMPRTSIFVLFFAGWIALATLKVTTLARPHIMALPAMTLWTAWLIHAASTTRRPPWLALGVMAVWSNLHAGFTIGYIIAGAVALDAIWRTEPAERLKSVALWLIFGCGCLVASMVNPYGYASLVINIQMFSGSESMPHIDEWAPMRLHEHNVFIVSYAVILIGSLFLNARQNIFRILLGAFIVYTCIKHERFVMLLAIIPPLLAQESAPRLIRIVLDRFKLFQDPDPLRQRGFWKPMLPVLPAAFVAVMMLKPFVLPKLQSREAALAAVPAEIRKGKVFNSYNIGGFLVSRNVPTFIDGRTDQLFLGGFTDYYVNTTRSDDLDRLERLIAQHGATWAIVDTEMNESRMFPKMPGWKQIHADEHTHVYIKSPG